MMHKAWCNLEGVPYNFSRSSIKFQGHTDWKIDDLNPIWVRLLGRIYIRGFTVYLARTGELWVWMCDLTVTEPVFPLRNAQNKYALGQKFSDFFLDVPNLQIYLFWIATKIWHIVRLAVLCNLYNFLISVLICNASTGIKDGPECESAIFTYTNN